MKDWRIILNNGTCICITAEEAVVVFKLLRECNGMTRDWFRTINNRIIVDVLKINAVCCADDLIEEPF